MRVLPCVVAAVLLAPSTAFADVIFRVSDGDGELGVVFGLAPFEISSEFEPVDPVLAPLLDSSISLVSGPLLSLDVDEENGVLVDTDYSYGAGVLTLHASWFRPDGTLVQGRFTAATKPFDISVDEDAVDDIFDGAPADDFVIELGDGLFSGEFAALLNVRRRTTGGGMLLGLEDIGGGPDDEVRRGFDHRGFADLNIITSPRAVPEPSVLALALVGAAWMTRRKARSIH